jgi:hypothetical protein
MVADLFTKLVVAAQDTRLTFRFYSLLTDMHHLVASNDFKKSQEDLHRSRAFFHAKHISEGE